jgi:hypothetical protein
LTAKLLIPHFGFDAFDQFGFVNSNNDFRDNVVFVNECVMSHYDQLTFPVPAVIVAYFFPPEAADSVPVRPAPIVIVKLSG